MTNYKHYTPSISIKGGVRRFFFMFGECWGWEGYIIHNGGPHAEIRSHDVVETYRGRDGHKNLADAQREYRYWAATIIRGAIAGADDIWGVEKISGADNESYIRINKPAGESAVRPA